MGKTYQLAESLILSGPILEIGTDRGEGSTAYLANIAKKQHVDMVTVDIDEHSLNRVSSLQIERIKADGSSFLIEDDREWGLVYLDNHDWDYGDNQDAIIKQKERYVKLQFPMSNLQSQTDHACQAGFIIPSSPIGWIIIDDTFKKPDGTFDGKGGAAVPLLLGLGWVIDRIIDYGIRLRYETK